MESEKLKLIAAVSARAADMYDEMIRESENGRVSVDNGKIFSFPLALDQTVDVTLKFHTRKIGISSGDLDSGRDGSGADGRKGTEGESGGEPRECRNANENSEGAPADGPIALGGQHIFVPEGPDDPGNRPNSQGDVLQDDSPVRPEVRTEE